MKRQSRAGKYLQNGGASEWLNVGTGRGHSVNEVIATTRQVTNCEIEVSLEPPRPGDPSRWLLMLGRRKQSWVGARNTLNSKQSSELRGSGIKRIRKITRSGLPVVMNKGSNPTIVNLLDRTHSLAS